MYVWYHTGNKVTHPLGRIFTLGFSTKVRVYATAERCVYGKKRLDDLCPDSPFIYLLCALKACMLAIIDSEIRPRVCVLSYCILSPGVV